MLFYRKQGYPAITDANLVLGRILPEFFPSIFGEDEKQPLDAAASKEALKKITDQVNEQGKASGQPDKSVEEVQTHCIALQTINNNTNLPVFQPTLGTR